MIGRVIVHIKNATITVTMGYFVSTTFGHDKRKVYSYSYSMYKETNYILLGIRSPRDSPSAIPNETCCM